MNKENKTYFIKPSRPIGDPVKLDPIRINNNKLNGTETSIALDTNILIRMEKVVKEGNKWASVKKHGLHNLIFLLEKTLPRSACISPGLALAEMPPQNAKIAREFYEQFCSIHLPTFVDIPNCSYTTYFGTINDYGFSDVSEGAKSILAIPFASLIYLNLADKLPKAKPIDKFKTFLDYLENKVDFLSATEIEIAKYCFIEPHSNAKETIDLRKKIRNNFVKTKDEKTPKTIDEVLKIAFNGANDIKLLHTANSIEQTGFDGVPQDSWIATQDKKLVDFSSVFHHIKLDGEVAKYAFSKQPNELLDDEFWQIASNEVNARIGKRLYHSVSREVTAEMLIKAAEDAIEHLKESF